MADEVSSGNTEPTLTLFKGKTETKFIALGIILAAVYGMSALVPLSVFIGGSGVITVAICIAPLFGILLGPWRGFAFGLVGGIIAALIAIEHLAVWTMLFGPAVSGLFTGLCYKRSTQVGRINIPGPALTFVFLVIMISLYEIQKSTAWWFMIPHLLAGVLALTLQVRNIVFDPVRDDVFKYLQFFPLVFIGTMLEQSMMMIGAVYLIQIPSDVFGFIIFPLMLIERIIATVVGVIISSAVLLTFKHELFYA